MPHFPLRVVLTLFLSLWTLVARANDLASGSEISPDQPLLKARRLLREGHYDEAAALAQSYVAEDPSDGAAFMVIGLAYYRSSHYEDALRAFRTARATARPPSSALLSFNEGSAYFALNRFTEAQTAFNEAAAADPSLALLATANAGHAALGAGDIAKARRYALSLKNMPHDSSATSTITELTDAIDEAEIDQATFAIDSHRGKAKAALNNDEPDVAAAEYMVALEKAEHVGSAPQVRAELWYALGYARYRGLHYKEAAEAFKAASNLSPKDGEFVYMAALCAYRMGQLDVAHKGFEAALRLGLDADSRKLARGYLASTDWGMNARGEGLTAHAGVSSGYDSNVAQLGGITEVVGGEVQQAQSGAFVSANVDAQWGTNVGARGYVRADYSFDQLAYTDAANDPFSLQVHAAALRSQYQLKPVFLGLAFLGDYQFSGLSNFTPFLVTGTIEPSLVVPESAFTSSALRLRVQEKSALDSSYQQFSGRRTDLRVSQKLRWKAFRLDVSYGHRRERIGSRTVDLGSLPPRLGAPAQPIRLRSEEYVAPYSYDANGLYIGSSFRLSSDFRLGLDASYEHLRYIKKNKLELVTRIDDSVQPQGQPVATKPLGATRRVDNRFGLGAGVWYSMGQWFEAGLRYDVIANDSTIDYWFDNKNFTKHQIMLELSADY